MISITPDLKQRKNAELIVLPFWEGAKSAIPAAELGALKKNIQAPLSAKDFLGKRGETSFLYIKGEKEKRCLLLGLGKHENLTVENLRRAFCEVPKFCQTKALKRISVVFPSVTELRYISVEEAIEGICEGLLLANYCFENLGLLEEETILLTHIQLIGILPKMMRCVKEVEAIVEGVYFCRDLINGNADDITPQVLAAGAKKIAESFPKVSATIFDKKRILKENLGLLTAVSRGSCHDPVFIILSYRGRANSKDHTVLVGKGITYDTGGLNLKPTGSMETMRDDMSGAATILSTIAVSASLNLKVNVTAVIPATENSIDSLSFKPGDIYQAFSGMTVEIANTDAEGRLVLADALSYAVKHLNPTRMIDLATLTGSAVIALGHELAPIFSNDDNLCQALLDSSAKTSEILWRMPLFSSYNAALKSDIADIKNLGGRPAGSIVAALFLQHFVEKIPWAHIDIAGTAFQNKEIGYWPKHGVGFGVRLLINFLKNIK